MKHERSGRCDNAMCHQPRYNRSSEDEGGERVCFDVGWSKSLRPRQIQVAIAGTSCANTTAFSLACPPPTASPCAFGQINGITLLVTWHYFHEIVMAVPKVKRCLFLACAFLHFSNVGMLHMLHLQHTCNSGYPRTAIRQVSLPKIIIVAYRERPQMISDPEIGFLLRLSDMPPTLPQSVPGSCIASGPSRCKHHLDVSPLQRASQQDKRICAGQKCWS